MDKLTIFFAVLLIGILRGLLQRRHVKAELEERMAKAKNGPAVRRLAGRLPADHDQEGLNVTSGRVLPGQSSDRSVESGD
jgi:hypothetical protein